MDAATRSDSCADSLPIAFISEDQKLCFLDEAQNERAWSLGIFYLELPESLDLDAARRFGHALLDPDNEFRKIPQYGDLEGFIALENNQQTKLALRRCHWGQHYPLEIATFGRSLDAIGVAIMREVLAQSGIPESCWNLASGGYTSGAGTAFLNFVHYDTRTADEGLRPHTDYGFVTILDATKPGLQVELNGVFQDVPVRPGHLVIHFGEALRFVTTYAEKSVTAVRHRVLSQSSSDTVRSGIVYFANPDLDGDLVQFNADGLSRGKASVRDFFGLLERALTD